MALSPRPLITQRFISRVEEVIASAEHPYLERQEHNVFNLAQALIQIRPIIEEPMRFMSDKILDPHISNNARRNLIRALQIASVHPDTHSTMRTQIENLFHTLEDIVRESNMLRQLIQNEPSSSSSQPIPPNPERRTGSAENPTPRERGSRGHGSGSTEIRNEVERPVDAVLRGVEHGFVRGAEDITRRR